MKQEKSLFEQMGGTYSLGEDGYYYPDLNLPTEEDKPIGIWGQRHLRYIRQNKRAFYISLKMTGKLNGYLADIDEQAEEMLSRLVKQMADKEGIPERLKMENQMEWVQRMNNIRSRAMEVVNSEIIYAIISK